MNLNDIKGDLTKRYFKRAVWVAYFRNGHWRWLKNYSKVSQDSLDENDWYECDEYGDRIETKEFIYPIYKESTITPGNIAKFTSLTQMVIVNSKDTSLIGREFPTATEHTNKTYWKPYTPVTTECSSELTQPIKGNEMKSTTKDALYILKDALCTEKITIKTKTALQIAKKHTLSVIYFTHDGTVHSRKDYTCKVKKAIAKVNAFLSTKKGDHLVAHTYTPSKIYRRKIEIEEI